MFRLSEIALIALVVLLTGCDSDFAELKFGSPVVADKVDYSNGSWIRPVYRQEIESILTAAGADPDLVKIHHDKDDYRGQTILLSTPMFGGITTEQKTAIKTALDSVVAGRSNSLNARFILHPQAPDSEIADTENESYREAVATLEAEYNTELTLDDVIIGIAYSLSDTYMAALQGNRESSGEALCTVSMTLSPLLPFRDIKIVSQDNQVTGFALVKPMNRGFASYDIPADIHVDYPLLQTKLDDKEALISTELTNSDQSPLNRGEIKTLEIQVGPIKEVKHQLGKMNNMSIFALKDTCRKMAAEKLGRPFTYSMGESFDRLESVRFL
ncbi:hypothetical protein [Thalassolituus sp. C2-1]|uniref:hypothetical protein n=1 Tax=Venatorbacter sp. C2-1 TaxID=2597518 RepID=UPI00118F2A84|nr:hypothetical protein [Thalassolituus sp. C2-1]TVV45406.1 hypothetical protein FOT50_00790 [Thalassolituus sp. C2-1]